MGTVIFPDARFKFFLDASPQTRAKRRLLDPKNREKNLDLETLTQQIAERDQMDRSRAIAPLKAASDAVTLDTSDYTIDAVLHYILHYIDTNGGREIFLV